MNLIDKLRKQSESTRKIILWSVVIIIGIVLVFFWIRGISQKMKAFEPINLPDFKDFSKIELLEFSEEELEQLEQ